MNRRPLVILVIVLCLATTWWWVSSTPAGQKSAQTPPATTTADARPAATVSAPSISRSISPPTGTSASRATSAPAAQIPDRSPATPAELTAALSGLVEQIQSNDFSAILDNYADPVSLAQMRADAPAIENYFHTTPHSPMTDIWVQVLQGMKDQTPEFNGAGDVATYNVSDPTGRGIDIQPITLHRVNGQWYFTVTGILKGAAGYGLMNDPPGGM